MNRIKLLLADDHPKHIEIWGDYISDAGISDLVIDDCYDHMKMYDLLMERLYDVIFLDMDWSGSGGKKEEGLNILRCAKDFNPNCEVIIFTAYGAGENFERIKNAYELGVLNYINKNIVDIYDDEHYRYECITTLRQAIEKVKLRKKSQLSFLSRYFDDEAIPIDISCGDLIGRSDSMRRIGLLARD